MPTYDYRCENCQKTTEAFQSISAAPLKTCPHCGKDSLRRLISSRQTTLQFHGDGFYETDYKKKEGTVEKKPGACEGGSCSHCTGSR